MSGIHLRRKKKKSRARGWGRRETTTAEVKLLKKPTGLVAASIEREIKRLRELETWSFRAHHGRTDFYKYLDGVYNAWDWTDKQDSRRVGRNVAALYDIDTRENKSPIRIVIDATAEDQDRKVKSKWASTLEYAVVKKVSGARFKEFLNKNGGVYGCSQKMAELRRKGIGRKGKTGRKRDESDD
jgi:hypothetical protein